MNKKILELLYCSFDDELTQNEKELLEKALSKSEKLRQEKNNIAAMRATISKGTSQSFHPFFTEKVMRRIHEEEKVQDTFFESLVYMFRPVAIAAAILIAALISYNLIRSDQLSVASAFAEPEITLEQAYEPIVILTLE